MSQEFKLNKIAQIHSGFPDKFGIPRQSGLVDSLKATVIFEPEYRVAEAFRGLEGYSHIWLLWQFSEAVRDNWSPTVRPPRLGGNKHVGVFATRSPFRPNPIGLSCVKLDRIEYDEKLGPVLYVSGADLMNGTPIYDIKPYLPYTDAHTGASGGFTDQTEKRTVEVVFDQSVLDGLPQELVGPLTGILAQDPRPAYQKDPDRIYKMKYAGYEVHFTVDGDRLRVIKSIKEQSDEGIV